MWILLAVLLYLVCSIAAAILLGRCLRYGLQGRRAEDILKAALDKGPAQIRRNQKRFRESAAFVRAGR